MPALARFADWIDAINESIGRGVAWLTLFMVLMQFVIVMMRYVFGIASIFLQESMFYMHSIVFLAAAGYALLHGSYVRIDIFYAKVTTRGKAVIDFLGVIFLLIPFSALIFWTSWPYVSRSWMMREGSPDGAGIPAVYLLKTIILLYAAVVLIQGISLAARSLVTLVGSGRRSH